MLVIVFILLGVWCQSCHQNRDIKDIKASLHKLTTTQPTTTPPDQTLDIVAKVEAFYSHIFMYLLPVVVVVGIFATIVVPIVVHRLQQEAFDKVIKPLEESVAQQATLAINQLDSYAAILWLEIAESAIETDGPMYPRPYKYYCYAINSALKAHWEQDEPLWQKILLALTTKQDDLQKGVANKDPQQVRPVVQNTLARLKCRGPHEPYLTLCKFLEWFIT